jgi:aminomethyltransferase
MSAHPLPPMANTDSPSSSLRRTDLENWHISRGATMTDFNGWNMPLYYEGMTAEHLHTRSAAGLFDLGHMGRVWVTGPEALEYLKQITPAQLEEARIGDVLYSFLLRPDGTTIDDITIYLVEAERFLLVVNAGNRERAVEWMKVQAADFPVDAVVIDDASSRLGMIAIQGPMALPVMQVLFGENTEFPSYYRFTTWYDTVRPGPLLVSRTGYTGEDGFELYPQASTTFPLWEALLECCPEAGVKPIGLGARDSLRLEAAMPLYGHEWDDTTTPVEAGLTRFLTKKRPYSGSDALTGHPRRKLIGWRIDARGPIPRQGTPVATTEDGPITGIVTSGVFSPTLKAVIGLAYVEAVPESSPAVFPKPGETIFPEVRGNRVAATVVQRPFYKRSRP